MRRVVLLISVAVALVAGACGGDRRSSAPTTAVSTTAVPTRCTPTDIERTESSYRTVPGSPPDLTTLEVIRPTGPGCGSLPVMVWVHGGGWRTGDRRQQLDDKVRWFTEQGWALVSVNYRLSPAVRYPAHNDDVAAAIDWVLDRADSLELDPDRLSIMGHSAGAGIVAGVLADEDHLGAFGRSTSVLTCAVLLDTEGYDVVAQASEGNRIYLAAFGDDPRTWVEASPIRSLRPGAPLPDTLVVTRGARPRQRTAAEFVEALRAAGGRAELLDANPLDHAQVNRAVGDPEDRIVSPAILELLDRC